MQNREMIMHKVGKWFMIIGIAGLLSLLFIEWSRWNLVPLSEKINLVRVSEIYREFHTEFIEGGIATFSIFALFAHHRFLGGTVDLQLMSHCYFWQ